MVMDSPIDSARLMAEWIQKAWKDAKSPPRIGDLMPPSAWDSPELIAAVLEADADERSARGLPVRWADWVADTPQLAELPAARLPGLILEIQASRRAGEHDLEEQLRERYPELETDWKLALALAAVETGGSALHLEAGARLGSYRLERELGRGRFGCVWMAFDEETHRYVALKLLPRTGAQVRERVEVGLAEARAASRIDNPHVVKVHRAGVFETAGLVFLDCQLVGDPMAGDEQRVDPGLSLRDYAVDESGKPRLSHQRVAELHRDIARGLSAAHARGVVHRDIKPANILVRRKSGEALLADFGLASAGLLPEANMDVEATASMRWTSGDRTVAGTPAYMAPEVARGQSADPRSDLYGLGASLYYCLTGQHPYQSLLSSKASSREFLEVAAREPLPEVRELMPSVPRALAAICEKALARDQDARYQSADRFEADLQAWLEHRTVSAFKAGPCLRARLWVRRNPLIAASLLVVVILLTSLALLSLSHIRTLEANDRRQRELLELQGTLIGFGGKEKIAEAFTEKAFTEHEQQVRQQKATAGQGKYGVSVFIANRSPRAVLVWMDSARERQVINPGEIATFRPNALDWPTFTAFLEFDEASFDASRFTSRYRLPTPLIGNRRLIWDGGKFVAP